jgi:dTDP-4-dehydrorhamnose 3,5-epimerase
MHKKLYLLKNFDKRGSFKKIFNKNNFKIEQVFISKSKKNTFRGFHFYSKKNKSNRIIYLNKGEIIDYIVDLRKKSFGKVYKIKIKQNSKFCLIIPYYCGHAFFAKKDSEVIYFFEKSHKKKYDMGLKIPSLLNSFKKKIMSKRDKSSEDINNIKNFF